MHEQPHPQSKRYSPLITLLIALVILGAAGLAVALGVFEAKNTNEVIQTNTNTADGNQNAPSTNSSSVNTEATTNTSQTGTEGWKTYKDKDSSFTIQYPPNWEYFVRLDGQVAFAPKGGLGKFPEVAIAPILSTGTTYELQRSTLDQANLLNRTDEETTFGGRKSFFIEGTEPTRLADGSTWFIQRLLIDGNPDIFILSGNNAQDVFEKMVATLQLP